MATYAIGDVQGCFRSLERLLATLPLDERRDRLWLAGDLVNRGRGSLEVLRWAEAQGDRVTAVLGNHDLHLLAVDAGVRHAKAGDTLGPLLRAPDRPRLLDWLRRQPLLHREGATVMVHAGLLPEWTLDQAEALAREVEAELRGPTPGEALRRLCAGSFDRWPADPVDATTRTAATVAVMTRLRTLHTDGAWCRFTGPPAEAPDGCVPWFDLPHRRGDDALVVFGHWSALGVHQGPGAIGLDTGCVWGRQLTAVRLDDRAVFQVDCAPDDRAPDGRG